ncbi:MAG: NAD(P)-binding protein [Spirochaetes bacterium]|nr:NAD(P)-binding protein [Spirochaetota bacterium]
MAKKDQTIILGAGLSGMIAAIVLAKQGRGVKVIERAKDIGGDLALHPSLHATPINTKKVADWTGLDTSKMFTKGKVVKGFFADAAFTFPPMYLIERGKRPTAIDVYLYEEAKKLGVDFEFNHTVDNPKELPKGSIIATGFYPDMFDIFKTPCRNARGFFALKKNTDPELDGSMYLWMGPYSEDYAYACVINGLLYIALFSRFGLPDESLDQFKVHLEATMGWKFDKWLDESRLTVPCASIKRPQLFVDDYILTGTVGGNMDPFLGFGIHGAILSGVTAAWAVTDPEKALKEHKKLTSHYQSSYITFELQKGVPNRDKIFKFCLSHPKLISPFTGFISKGLPGYDGDWVKETFGGKLQ